MIFTENNPLLNTLFFQAMARSQLVKMALLVLLLLTEQASSSFNACNPEKDFNTDISTDEIEMFHQNGLHVEVVGSVAQLREECGLFC